jgi:hypothetical protein
MILLTITQEIFVMCVTVSKSIQQCASLNNSNLVQRNCKFVPLLDELVKHHATKAYEGMEACIHNS